MHVVPGIIKVPGHVVWLESSDRSGEHGGQANAEDGRSTEVKERVRYGGSRARMAMA